jgi:hypothetical protein
VEESALEEGEVGEEGEARTGAGLVWKRRRARLARLLIVAGTVECEGREGVRNKEKARDRSERR